MAAEQTGTDLLRRQEDNQFSDETARIEKSYEKFS
jgi:hypothetical protein